MPYGIINNKYQRLHVAPAAFFGYLFFWCLRFFLSQLSFRSLSYVKSYPLLFLNIRLIYFFINNIMVFLLNRNFVVYTNIVDHERMNGN